MYTHIIAYYYHMYCTALNAARRDSYLTAYHNYLIAELHKTLG